MPELPDFFSFHHALAAVAAAACGRRKNICVKVWYLRR